MYLMKLEPGCGVVAIVLNSLLGCPDQSYRHAQRCQGSAPIQHAARKRREITGINRIIRTRERAARLVGLAARFTQDRFEKPQVSGPISALEELAGHHHALNLVGALVDLGDL